MSDRIRCACRRCAVRGLMWPAIFITVGVLFLLHEMRGGYFNFDNTYPVILIVIGVISLGSALASAEGHISGTAPPGTPGAPGSLPGTPPNPFPPQGQGQ